jgi:uncharacterized membrane protein
MGSHGSLFAGGVLGVVSVVSVPLGVSAQERPYDFWWGMHPMWGMWSAWGFGMMLIMLVFWGLVIVGLVLGLRWLLSQGRRGHLTQALCARRDRQGGV